MKSFSILSLLALSIVLFSCGKDDPSQADKVRSMLTSGAWKVQSVTVDDQDALDFFTNLSVTFTKTGFTTSNPGPIWPASGSWDFSNAEATHILRGDGLDITIDALSDTEFRCTLYWDELVVGPGRADAIVGTHKFVFTK